MRGGILLLVITAYALIPQAAFSESDEVVALRDQVEALTERLERIERSDARGAHTGQSGQAARLQKTDLHWTERLELSGNADFAYFNGDRNARDPEGRFVVENARIFFDFDLTDYRDDSDTRIAESTSLFIEWDMIREGSIRNRFGSVYLQLDRLLDRRWLNMRLGRMPIPFGLEYQRFHQARRDNPLLSYSVTAPYNWDQGVSFFGDFADRRIEYVVAILNGDSRLSNSHSEPTFSSRLTGRPLPWLEISASALRSGRLGNDIDGGRASIEFAGIHPTPFGAESDVLNFANGVAIPDDPAALVDRVNAWELDLKMSSAGIGHTWFSYGAYDIASDGASSYDRDLRYWVAEGVLEMSALADWLGWSRSLQTFEPWYLALRHSAVGTYDSNEGYLLGFMNEGEVLGFNTKSVVANTVGVGYRLGSRATLKLEYSHFDVDLVRGVTDELRDLAGSRNYLAVGLTAGF